jgi:hypothetical protein
LSAHTSPDHPQYVSTLHATSTVVGPIDARHQTTIPARFQLPGMSKSRSSQPPPAARPGPAALAHSYPQALDVLTCPCPPLRLYGLWLRPRPPVPRCSAIAATYRRSFPFFQSCCCFAILIISLPFRFVVCVGYFA